MQYLNPKFTLPAGPKKVTQEEWDRIFKDVKVSEPKPELPEWFRIGSTVPGPALRTSKKS